MTGELVTPHGGGDLNPLLVSGTEAAALAERAAGLRQVPMTSREVSDLLLMAMGAYTPINGFMDEGDWRGAVEDMKLADGTFWPIPVTLSANAELAGQVEAGEDVAMLDAGTGTLMAVMTVTDKYTPDRERECAQVFQTTKGSLGRHHGESIDYIL